ncbi:MAG TPA: sodium:calcium antiporter [Candidatus Limnocylindria bacterium]|nr:sodium:calcium antiporter [Candidatus Limnocylindria bacterium]
MAARVTGRGLRDTAGRMVNRVWLGVAVLLPFIWFVLHGGQLVTEPTEVALWAGLAIFGAAFLLSWGCEVVQLDIPQALALALLALIAVLPEYAVDMYFAWQAGKDPTYTAFATANMTGANRLLLGVGWAVPVLINWARYRHSTVTLPREGAVEIRYLAFATAYSFIIPWKGTLNVLDTLILLALFAAYVRAASQAHHTEPELEGPAEMIAGWGAGPRRVAVAVLGVIAGAAILSAAEPFAESLIEVGRHWGVEEFLLVQWLAPLASESPEFIVCILFAWRGLASAGISTMVSSKVNQWTLLVGALPLVFSISAAHLGPMLLDDRQREEIFLTSAQSLFGLMIIANYSFGVLEALALFVLFVVQLLLPSPHARWIFAWIYIALAVGMSAISRETRQGVAQLLGGAQRRRTLS